MYDSIDDFYRLFMIPGMGHCTGGPGAWNIWRVTNTPNQTDYNILLSLVEWVESGEAPGVIIGIDEEGQERKHCMWPSSKSVWDGTSWDCIQA